VLRLPFVAPAGRALRILALGAHSDDLEIGCGGTLLQLVGELRSVEVTWAVASVAGERITEAEASAADYLKPATSHRVVVGSFRDGHLPYEGGAVKEWVHGLAGDEPPDVVLTHHRGDLHQDHRLLAELALNAFRDQLILGFEIPKYDGDLGAPNVFVHVEEETVARKVELLHHHFASQRDKPWFHEETFRGLMRLRGIESRSPSGYAEAFYATKLVLGS
jgi:LmbE family N-acetylglucosaminyl deacetylase